jgi:hypothetical protein
VSAPATALCIALADAEVGWLVREAGDAAAGDTLRVRLAAAPGWPVVDGRPNAREPGHARGVGLRFAGATLSGDTDGAFGRLSQGRVWHAGRWRGTLDLPGELAGPLRAEWRFGNGSELLITATGLRCDWLGPADFGASLAC